MENQTDIKLESLTEEQLETILKERDEAKSLAEKKAADLDNVVNELKELRAKREVVPPKEPTENEDVAQIINARFEEAEKSRQAKELAEAQSRAKEKFFAEHKEFLPENDSSGIRRAALEGKLSRFNLNAAQSEDDALEILNDAYELLSRRGEVASVDGGIPPPAGSSSRHVGGSSLTAKELGAIQRLGWTREKFIDMKLKHPNLVSELFK